jgi:hypothetical protein
MVCFSPRIVSAYMDSPLIDDDYEQATTMLLYHLLQPHQFQEEFPQDSQQTKMRSAIFACKKDLLQNKDFVSIVGKCCAHRVVTTLLRVQAMIFRLSVLFVDNILLRTLLIFLTKRLSNDVFALFVCLLACFTNLIFI